MELCNPKAVERIKQIAKNHCGWQVDDTFKCDTCFAVDRTIIWPSKLRIGHHVWKISVDAIDSHLYYIHLTIRVDSRVQKLFLSVLDLKDLDNTLLDLKWHAWERILQWCQKSFIAAYVRKMLKVHPESVLEILKAARDTNKQNMIERVVYECGFHELINNIRTARKII